MSRWFHKRQKNTIEIEISQVIYVWVSKYMKILNTKWISERVRRNPS